MADREIGAPDAADETAAQLPSELAALRASGADQRDPIRYAYLVALARRAAVQPDAIRRTLAARIGAAARELAARPAAAPTASAGKSPASPLAELLAYIGQHAHEAPEVTRNGAENASATPNQVGDSGNAPAGRRRTGQAPELKSVAYFRNTWSKLSTEQRLTQTLAQAPENAGPMNSQHLVLRSLQVMRDIAPDYLQGFMSYVDTLIWLEHADPTKPASGRSSGGEEANRKTRAAKRSPTNR